MIRTVTNTRQLASFCLNEEPYKVIFALRIWCESGTSQKYMHRFKGRRKTGFRDLSDAIVTHLHRISLHPPAFHKAKKTAANVPHPQGSLLADRFLFSFSGLALVGFRGRVTFWRTHWGMGCQSWGWKKSVSSFYSGTMFQRNQRVEIQGGHRRNRGNHKWLKCSYSVHSPLWKPKVLLEIKQ